MSTRSESGENRSDRDPGSFETDGKSGTSTVKSMSRRNLLAGAGGTAALAAFLAACGGGENGGSNGGMGATGSSGTTGSTDMAANSTDQFGKGDLGILNYALTLEYLETAFYSDVAKSGLFKGSDLATIRMFGQQEAGHVAALTSAIKKAGGKPAKKPKTEFPLKNAKQVLKLASTVENLGAAAYLGQAARIKSPEVLAAALSIHSVEGRHAAALNQLLGKSPTPDGPFAVPADARMVLNAVEPFIVD